MAQFPLKSYDLPLAVGNGSLERRDPIQAEALMKQVAAAGTVTIGGTETDGDTLTLTFTDQQLPGGSHAVHVVTAGSETLSQIATDFKNAINNDTLLAGLGYVATSLAAVLTVKPIPGPLGNFMTMAFTKSGGATETGTVVQPKGGSGYIVPQQDAEVVVNGSLLKLKYGEPRLLGYNTLKTILAAGVSVK